MSDTLARIYSWNVNGLRAASRKGLQDWMATAGAEIVGMQEVRAFREQLPGGLKDPDDWHVHVHSAQRPGYSGVALYSQRAPDHIETSLGVDAFDEEGRVQIATYGDLTLANIYFPNGSGKNRDNSRIPFKLDFYRALFDRLEPLRAAGRAVLVIGDYNTAHHEIDLARPKSNVTTSGFRPEERDELTRWLDAGWVDTFRALHPEAADRYTWWSNRRGVRERNVGWRIDYVYASPGAWPHVRAAHIHDDVMGSDHCPISVDVDRAIFGGATPDESPPEDP